MKAGNTTQENEINWAWKNSNDKIRTMCKTDTLQSYIEKQNVRWVAHVVRAPNETLKKRLMFEEKKYVKVGHHHKTVYERVIKTEEDWGVSAETFLRNCIKD